MNYNDFPYRVEIEPTEDGIDIFDIDWFDWLEENVSEYNDLWTYTGFDVAFKDSKHAMMFGLWKQ